MHRHGVYFKSNRKFRSRKITKKNEKQKTIVSCCQLQYWIYSKEKSMSEISWNMLGKIGKSTEIMNQVKLVDSREQTTFEYEK